MNVIEYIISSIAPNSCVQCGAEGALLCHHCIQNLPPTPSCCYVCKRPTRDWRTCAACREQSALVAVSAATPYANEVKRLLYVLKFDRAAAAARDVAATIAQSLADVSLPPNLVVTHVPTAQARMRQRGYDQSALIAKEVARLSERPYAPLLQRMGSQRQVGKTRAARKQQMTSAFRPIHTPLAADRPVLLIDDVLTTGATLESAGQTLQQAGAGKILAAVFARA
jgi:ComF family protein